MDSLSTRETGSLPARLRVLLGVLVFALPTLCSAVEEVITIPTRAGVTDSYLLTHNPSAAPKVAVISFVGSEGAIKLAERAQSGPVKFGPSANFLVRIRGTLAGPEIADAIVDAPSDQLPGGMSDDFRLGADHLTDIRAVIADLKKRFPGVRIVLIGTSRGTISAGALGAKLGDEIQGVVLTSTLTRSGRRNSVYTPFDYATLKGPVLYVHHRDDACPASPYANVVALARTNNLVTVNGNDPPQSGPCDPLAQHGYIGREAQVTAAIKSWLLGGDVPREIP